MKPMGPIPPGFPARDGELAMAGRTASALIAEEGDTPLFVYDGALVAARIARLRAALPLAVAIHYAVKANPHPPLLAAMAPQVDGFDVASAGEMTRALAWIAADRISFAGPGKRDDELAAAIGCGCTINLESEREADRALALAWQAGVTPRLAVRVNPPFELRGSGMRMGGGARPFGVDASRVPALVRRLIAAGADWRGFHVYAGSQSLDAGAIIETQAATVTLAAELAQAAGASPPLVNLGGGFGIPYFAGDAALDVEAIGAALGDALSARAPILAGAGFALELGRWLVGEAGVYLTRVVDRKESHGRVFLVTDGGLNHQLGATGNLGAAVRRNYPVAIATRFAEEGVETASIVGPLCTPLDRLAEDVVLPRADVGDVVVVFLAGAYGLSASPSAFLGHRLPRERVVGVQPRQGS